MTVACVLRSGGIYTPLWVQRLAAGVRQYHDGADFVCLSDVDVPGVETVPLLHRWPGWWSKIELFRPGLFSGPVLYIDLDTLVLGPLDDVMAYRGPMAMLSDFFRPAVPESGVMAWNGPRDALWDAWMDDPDGHIKRHRRDGRFLASQGEVDRIQDLVPDQVVSWKVHGRQLPPSTRLLCFHGDPKPHNVGGWPQAAWEALA